MTSHDSMRELLQVAKSDHPMVRLVIVKTEGSAPRELGAAMLVNQTETRGTIGGGQLEFEAIKHARRLIERSHSQSQNWMRDLRTWPLGPALGQCCGGTVRVLFELYRRNETAELAALEARRSQIRNARGLLIHPLQSGGPIIGCSSIEEARALPVPLAEIVGDMLDEEGSLDPVIITDKDSGHQSFIEPYGTLKTPLFIYGAGHVGQAIVNISADLEFDIHWVDTHKERFPPQPSQTVQRVVARDPTIIARAAPAGAFHVVLTYSHALDLAICQSLLANPTFGFLGLIGSQTKRASFSRRLRAAGVSEAALSRLTCPIGIGQLNGKAPATIAVATAAQLIECQERSSGQAATTASTNQGLSAHFSR